MPAPSPQSKAEALSDRVHELAAEADRYTSVSAIDRRRLMSDIEELRKDSRGEADLLEAVLCAITGNLAGAEKACANASHLLGEVPARTTLFACYANMGYFSKARNILPSVLEVAPNLGELMSVAASIGSFRAMVKVIDDATAQQRVIPMNGMIPTIRDAAHVLDVLGVEEGSLASAIAMAGEVLTTHGILWKGMSPVVTVRDAGTDSHLNIDYAVGVSASVAAEWTWSLAKDLIRKDLELDGVTIGFVGVKDE